MIAHLDGSGAVTFLIAIPAMMSLYDELGMKRTTLATIVALAAGTMNILPWGGPTIRAASALEVQVTDLFNPLAISVLVGLISVFVITWHLGRKERSNIDLEIKNDIDAEDLEHNEEDELERPKLFWFNIFMIVVPNSYDENSS